MQQPNHQVAGQTLPSHELHPSEMELAFAGLHLLCAPLLDRLEGLPGPQRDALGIAFGLREGTAPDRFLVGLAVLTLLSQGGGGPAAAVSGR